MVNTIEILYLLLSNRSSSKIIHAALDGDFTYSALSKKISNLKERGLLKKDKQQAWYVTSKGKAFFESRNAYKYFESKTKDSAKKDYMIIFDIPESQRSKRDWLRYQIKQLHFVQIQKSVWNGPSPLPVGFLDYLEEIKIRDNVKVFSLRKEI